MAGLPAGQRRSLAPERRCSTQQSCPTGLSLGLVHRSCGRTRRTQSMISNRRHIDLAISDSVLSIGKSPFSERETNPGPAGNATTASQPPDPTTRAHLALSARLPSPPATANAKPARQARRYYGLDGNAASTVMVRLSRSTWTGCARWSPRRRAAKRSCRNPRPRNRRPPGLPGRRNARDGWQPLPAHGTRPSRRGLYLRVDSRTAGRASRSCHQWT